MKPRTVNLAEMFGQFQDHWSPKIVGEVNESRSAGLIDVRELIALGVIEVDQINPGNKEMHPVAVCVALGLHLPGGQVNGVSPRISALGRNIFAETLASPVSRCRTQSAEILRPPLSVTQKPAASLRLALK